MVELLADMEGLLGQLRTLRSDVSRFMEGRHQSPQMAAVLTALLQTAQVFQL